MLFDYFAGEILKRADPAVQDVLMRTAFLPRMTPAMAEALTGNANTGDMLATLHKQNYFTNKQAGTPPTYEYHPLFRDFLLARAARTYSRQTQAQIRAGRRPASSTTLAASRPRPISCATPRTGRDSPC